MLPPTAFIPVAEDTGLIEPLGEWVMAEACKAANVPCGIFTGNLAKALERREKGYQLVVLASDVDVMRDAFDGATRVFAENSP